MFGYDFWKKSPLYNRNWNIAYISITLWIQKTVILQLNPKVIVLNNRIEKFGFCYKMEHAYFVKLTWMILTVHLMKMRTSGWTFGCLRFRIRVTHLSSCYNDFVFVIRIFKIHICIIKLKTFLRKVISFDGNIRDFKC